MKRIIWFLMTFMVVFVAVLVWINRFGLMQYHDKQWNAAATGSGCQRFLPLSNTHAKEEHIPLTFTPSIQHSVRSPRYAAHTLYLDGTTARLAAEAGFDTIVQVFPWRDLNPQRGRYTWHAADDMVQNAQHYNLNLVVRLDMPPEWAIRDVTVGVPFDLPAYTDFVAAVASRYQGQILAYIIWNEPNLAAEWSRSGGNLPDHYLRYDGWVADPADYVGVLGAVYQRIREADPEALVVGGGLAPTNENSPRAVDDRLFLEGMLQAGAAACLDVLAVHDYGYGLSPDSDRMAQDGLNLARITFLHDILLAHDAIMPVWITELGYTINPGDHPAVSAQHQAEYLLQAKYRVAEEWPWVELFTVWNLVYGRSPGDEMSGYSLVEPDGTPRRAYLTWQQALQK